MGLQLGEAFLPLLNTRARYKAYYSGRGCAKSTSFAIAAIHRAATRPTRFLCCREIQNSIRESVKQYLDDAILRAGLTDLFLSTANTITCIQGPGKGSQFIFQGLRANLQSIRSLAHIDVCWVEEAATITQNSLNVLVPTIRDNSSEMWFSWNPRDPRDPVDVMFRKGDIASVPVPDEVKGFYDKWAIVEKVNEADNPDFPAALKAERERDRVRDPDKYKHIWLGEYAHMSDAAVFRNWKVGTVDVPADARPYYGADWGFSVDPTVLVRCYVLPEMRVLYIDAEASGVGVEIDRTPALFDSIANGPEDDLHPRKWPIMADSARPETISYMANHGYPQIERARKGTGSVEEGVEFIKSYDVVIHPNCKRVIDEFTFYSYERDKLTDEVLPKLLDKDNHTVDAVRYAVEAIRRTLTVTGGFGVVTKDREYFGDTSRQGMTNPALSPTNPEREQRREKGVVW